VLRRHRDVASNKLHKLAVDLAKFLDIKKNSINAKSLKIEVIICSKSTIINTMEQIPYYSILIGHIFPRLII
jgi:hypothetical protein